MQNKLTLAWLYAALLRAIRTVAQTALSLITVGAALNEIPWIYLLSVSVMAGIYSLLTSIATNLPEVGTDGIIKVSRTENPTGYICELGLDITGYTLLQKKTVNLTVVDINTSSQ